MVAITIILFLWVFAIAGYGSLFTFVKGRLGEADPSTLDLLQPLLGIGLLSAAVNLINFFLPISQSIALVFLLAGWLFLIKNNRLAKKPKWGMIAFAVVWITAIAWARALNRIDYYDSGFYGLQAVRWLQADPLPLGLANLHARLGLNSAWFSFASIIQLPFISPKIAIADEILVFFAGLAVFKGIQGLSKKNWDLNHIFLAAAGLAIITPELSTLAIAPLVNDVAIFWLTISEGYILLNLASGKTKSPYALWLSSTLAFMAITIKLSALTLLFVPITILAIRFDEIKENGADIVRAVKWIAASGSVFCFPWLLRSFLLSGCWLYPVVFSCQPRTLWAVPPDTVELISVIIRAWARVNDFDYAAVLSNWKWISKWLPVQLRSTELWFLFITLAVSVVLFIISQIGVREKRTVRREWIIQTPFYLGMVVWFLGAPAFRFGSGNFWAVALLMLASGLARLLAEENQASGLVKFFIASLLSMMVFVFALRFLAASVAENISIRDYWLLPAESPRVDIRPFVTENRQVIYEPVADDFLCWDMHLLCTPYPQANLNFVEKEGRYEMFFVVDEKK